MSNRTALSVASVLVPLLAASPAIAQEAEEADTGLSEIIVTAQKREQSLQDVPIAITAISQDQLTANRITNALDLTAQVPNLFIRKTGGGVNTPNFSMRGSVTYGSVAGQDKSISLYIDGVYIGLSGGSLFELPDLERIEVLRGPQGTLFGRNSTAGAISIITREPSGEASLRQVLTYGNYNHLRSSTRVELPAVGPFSASVSYTHSERDGEIKNLGAGTVWDRRGVKGAGGLQVSPKTLGDTNSESVFVALKFDPGSNFKSVYRFDWTKDNYTAQGACTVAIGNSVTPTSVLGLALAANPQQLCDEHRPKAVNGAFTVPGHLSAQGHSLTSTLELSDSLSIKNIVAYRKQKVIGTSDLTGLGGLKVTPAMVAVQPNLAPALGNNYVVFGSNAQSGGSHWSGELQVNYDSDPLTVTAGVYYFTLKSQTGSPDGLRGQINNTALPGNVIPADRRDLSYNKNRSAAAYMQAEAHVTPELDLIGGIRYTQDKKNGISYVFVSATSTTPGRQMVLPFDFKDSEITYSLGVNYKPNNDVLLYAKYSTGFVSGGSVSGYDYPSESVKAWEGGAKLELLDRRLRFNVALFHADYKNLQAVSGGRSIPPPNTNPDVNTLVLREGDLKTKGVELEATLVPARGLTLSGGLGYTDSKLYNVNTFLRPPGSNLATVRPKWTSNMSAQYDTLPLFADTTMMFRVDAQWRSSYITNNQRSTAFPGGVTPVDVSRAMWLINGRIALRDIDLAGSKAELAVWGRNLTDSDRPAQPINLGTVMSTNYIAARTYGVDLTFEF